MTPTPKPTPRPQATATPSAAQSAPAADLSLLDKELEDLLIEEVSLKDAVASLIAALELDERDVQSIDIRPHGTIRLRLEGNVARSITFPALQRHKRDDENRIIR
jgi:hypothetical protein